MKDADRAPAPWPWRGSRPGPPLPLFRPRFDRLVHPPSGRELERLVLEAPDWCNVVARTPAGRFVMVRQYRFGSRSVTLEIPGGMVDRGEAPEQGARRELREECGYAAPRWQPLGAVQANPAIHDNLLHMFLAEDALPVGAQQPDEGEDIQVIELSPEELRAAIAGGEVRHSLVLCALARVLDLSGTAWNPIERAGPPVGSA
jgi:8-oxo-dGTP pyrophosphatase MutT (NUDIX family)